MACFFVVFQNFKKIVGGNSWLILHPQKPPTTGMKGFYALEEYAPSGCFVTDQERLLYSPAPTCFNEERFLIIPHSRYSSGLSSEGIYDFYGYQYGAIVLVYEQLFNDYTTAKNSSDTHYSWYEAEF